MERGILPDRDIEWLLSSLCQLHRIPHDAAPQVEPQLGDDHLGGGVNNETLIGEAGNDILLGCPGKDILMGRGGDDTIEGDANVMFADCSWGVSRTVPIQRGITYYVHKYTFTAAFTEAGDDDVIYAGVGNDRVIAQGGDGFVDGKADDNEWRLSA